MPRPYCNIMIFVAQKSDGGNLAAVCRGDPLGRPYVLHMQLRLAYTGVGDGLGVFVGFNGGGL